MTFGDVWRSVKLQVPAAPPLLIQRWVQDVYNGLADRRGWVWTEAETILTADASRALTVGVTQGSSTVTSASFVAADVGRQLTVAGWTFTLLTVTVGVSATIDQLYPLTTDAAASGSVVSAYVVMPVDFSRATVLMERVGQRELTWTTTQYDLNRADPSRSQSGVPEVLAARGISAVTATLGQLVYEWYPRPASAFAAVLRYITRPVQMADATELRGVLANRGDVLEVGALARAAAWPGTTELANPYFNLALARNLRDEFERLAQQLDIRDDDQAQQSWTTDLDHRRPHLGRDLSSRLRGTDAALSDYF
jgi:hypothetical protein